MGIVKLLPVDLLSSADHMGSLMMVFAMLLSACIWNLGTWYFGLPASSSHTMIGAILGIGFGNALWNKLPLSSGVNWSKAADVGLALLVSPLVGFTLAGGLLWALRKAYPASEIHREPPAGGTPPLPIRLALIGTSTGVSLAHGSNDGQKGVGLLMLILIGVLPGQFALNPHVGAEKLAVARTGVGKMETQLIATRNAIPAAEQAPVLSLIPEAHGAGAPSLDSVEKTRAAQKKALETATALSHEVGQLLEKTQTSVRELSETDRFALRSKIFKLDHELGRLEKLGLKTPELKSSRKNLMALTEYAPTWVLAVIALALGVGTMIGWKRIAVTIGEKIGKSHLTYGQGAAAELVAMSTIGLSAVAGVPVSTTHCLSSGIAGTMVAAGSGVQAMTVRNILLAWVLTLPVTMTLSAGLFLALRWLVA
jgi:phosphate/sulfate permease